MASTLPPAAQVASQAALKTAIADSPELEQGEIEEGQDVVLDPAKFEEMRTVFQDPQTFNVKVSLSPAQNPLTTAAYHQYDMVAPALFALDALVRLAQHKGQNTSSDAVCVCAPYPRRRASYPRRAQLDGRH